jgi:hypothetical protein
MSELDIKYRAVRLEPFKGQGMLAIVDPAQSPEIDPSIIHALDVARSLIVCTKRDSDEVLRVEVRSAQCDFRELEDDDRCAECVALLAKRAADE